jgi:hypothetical protein
MASTTLAKMPSSQWSWNHRFFSMAARSPVGRLVET